MYGGVKLGGEVCRELWAFDVSAKSWENITVKAEPCLPNSTSLCGMCLVEPVSTYQDDQKENSGTDSFILPFSPQVGC